MPVIDAVQKKRKATMTTMVYTPEQQATSFMEAILADPTVLHPISDKLHCIFKKIPHPVFTKNVVDIAIRHQDLTFWESCVAELENPSETRNRMVSIGSPGIGKSTTALFLIRKLLYMGLTVVFMMKGEGLIVQFKPNGDKVTGANDVDVEIFPETTPKWEIASLLDQRTYYIVDPGMTKENCNPPGRVNAKVIIVASPDERHWGGNSFPKDEPGFPGGFYRYFPPWTLMELQAAAQEILNLGPVQSQEIERQFSVFGGIPRHVFKLSEAAENEQILEQRIRALSPTQARNLISGFFPLHAKFGADQPQGGITIFTPKRSFKGVTVSLASDSVRGWVRSFFMDNIWSDLALYPTPTAWQLLESYMMEALEKTNQYTVRKCVGKNENQYSHVFTVQLGGCASKSFQMDCTDAVFDGADNVLFYSSDSTHPLYDMVYKRGSIFHAFQVTVGRTHDSKEAQIRAIASRLLTHAGDELRLYYAVHESIFDSFVTNPVRPIAVQGVSLYHLCLQKNL